MKGFLFLISRAPTFFLIVLIAHTSLARAEIQRKFSEEAWSNIEKDFKSQIVLHPFNQELMKGTLSAERFYHYSNQDQFYLREFAKMVALLAIKLDASDDIKTALKLAQEALVEETQVSQNAPTAKEKPSSEQMMPTTLFYVSYLQSLAAFGTPEELASALLPCYWIYQVLAEELAKKAPPKGPYIAWIKTYTSPEYRKSVEEIRALTDKLAAKAASPLRAKMFKAFKRATWLEWRFWQGAYNLEKWTF